MISVGPYLVGALQLAFVVAPLAFAAWKLRGALLPSWHGAPARLVESIVAVALLTWLMELLGVVGMLYAGTLIAASLLTASITAFLRAGGADIGLSRRAGESISA